MTQHRSVDDALDHIHELGGRPVELEGILDTSFGWALDRLEYWLLHYPKAERRPGNLSRLALEFGDGSIRPNPLALARWEGKRIRVHGVVHPPKSPSSSGPFEGNGAYCVHLEVHSVQRVSSEQRKEGA